MKALRLVPLVILALVPAAAYSTAVEARTAADCSVRQTGLRPLTDMGRFRHRGHAGLLYPGANRPPRRYLQRGLDAARRVRPIRGRIGVVGVGMSNAMSEFGAFSRAAAQLPGLNPALTFVEGPGGGWDATRITKPGSPYWPSLDARIRRAKLQRNQVQVVWLKQMIAGEDRQFPQDARALQTRLRTIVRLLGKRFPNLRLIYVSSRTYGGYAISHLNPEPFAYQSGFAVKWLVQEGIQNRLGKVWVGWGPYLWTDGLSGRRDGLTWACEDVLEDGTHPSASGLRKVARLLTDFFSTDATAKTWFAPTA
ncbi:MAG TPA: hypothetical protein VHH55_04415 [Gaiellaceae bacterium]|nr:hypothetical protein [Gaiellaceae bacterium]